jgi:transcriptional regulator with XRE-family HTH domain
VTLSDRLKRLFDERGVSISEAARFANMEKQQVHRIVSGRNANPGIATVQRIVDGIGGTMSELFADEDERPA